MSMILLDAATFLGHEIIFANTFNWDLSLRLDHNKEQLYDCYKQM